MNKRNKEQFESLWGSLYCVFLIDRDLVFSGNALDELHLDDPLNLVDSIHRDTNSPISNSISAGLASSGLLGSSAPVNIPGMTERSVLTNFSPSTSSPLQHLHSTSFLTGSRFSHQDSMESVKKIILASNCRPTRMFQLSVLTFYFV